MRAQQGDYYKDKRGVDGFTVLAPDKIQWDSGTIEIGDTSEYINSSRYLRLSYAYSINIDDNDYVYGRIYHDRKAVVNELEGLINLLIANSKITFIESYLSEFSTEANGDTYSEIIQKRTWRR